MRILKLAHLLQVAEKGAPKLFLCGSRNARLTFKWTPLLTRRRRLQTNLTWSDSLARFDLSRRAPFRFICAQVRSNSLQYATVRKTSLKFFKQAAQQHLLVPLTCLHSLKLAACCEGKKKNLSNNLLTFFLSPH